MSNNRYEEDRRKERESELKHTVLLTVVVVGLHGLVGGGTGNELMAELGLVLLATVVVVELLVVLSLLTVVVLRLSVSTGQSKS